MKTKKEKRKGGIGSAWCLALGTAMVLVLLSGCENPAASTPKAAAYTTYLYMTDTTSGRVYAYDPATHTSLSPSLLTTAGSAGEIRFYKGIGYVAVGSGSKAGVYYFDPSEMVPTSKLLPGSGGLNAEYFAFASPTVAYFSVATAYSPTDTGAIYSFNPSNPGAGITQIATSVNKYLQDIVIGADGLLYVAENLDQTVVRINPATNVVTPIATTQSGTTGLFAGTFEGNAGIFVANTGGSLDFIANSGTTATAVATSGSVPFYPGRVVQLSTGDLIATGFDPSYANHTYYVKASGSPVTISEIQYNGTSFGSLSLAFDGTNVYVPCTAYSPSVTNFLYLVTGTTSPAASASYSVMTITDNLANVAFYQN